MASTALLVPEKLEQAQSQLQEVFGKAGAPEEDDGDDEKLQDFLWDVSDMNFYTWAILQFTDKARMHKRDKQFTWENRAQHVFKAIFLPLFQFIVPFKIIMFEIHDLGPDGDTATGYCPDVAKDDFFFRLMAFGFTIYSVWQVKESLNLGASLEMMKMEALHTKITGDRPNLCFISGWIVQFVCGAQILIGLMLMMSASATYMDLVVNCFGVNFILDIDDEWMTAKMAEQGQRCAKKRWKKWRDYYMLGKRGDADWLERKKANLSRGAFFRKHVVTFVAWFHYLTSLILTFTGYIGASYFLVCDSEQ